MRREKEYDLICGSEIIDDIKYKYRAEIEILTTIWNEMHPYGMGWAREEMAEKTIESIDIIEIEPETDDEEVINKIRKVVEDKFYG